MSRFSSCCESVHQVRLDSKLRPALQGRLKNCSNLMRIGLAYHHSYPACCCWQSRHCDFRVPCSCCRCCLIWLMPQKCSQTRLQIEKNGKIPEMWELTIWDFFKVRTKLTNLHVNADLLTNKPRKQMIHIKEINKLL